MLEQLLAAQIADYEREVAALTVRTAALAIAHSGRLERRLETNERRIIRSLSRLVRIEA
jgi:putative heme degradation protein